MFSQTLTIARNTFLESVRQPIYFILTAICGVAILLTTMTAAYSMDYSSTAEVSADDKVLFDIGLATVFVCGMLLAAFLATAVISREIDRKTVLTVVSKPVARPTVVLGKYLGVCGAIVIAVLTMLLFLQMGIRHKVMSTSADDLDMPVVAFTFGAVLLAVGTGVWCNYFYGWSFTQTATVLLFPLMLAAWIGVLLISKSWKVQPIGTDFKPEIAKASLCVVLAVMVLTGVATAASARLGQVMTLVICCGVFVLGLGSNYLLGSRAIDNQFIARVLTATPDSPSMAGLNKPGDSYTLGLELEPRIGFPTGSPVYYGPNPSGSGLVVRPYPAFTGDLATPSSVEGSGPPAFAIGSHSARTLKIVRTGPAADAAPASRPPEKGDYLFLRPTRYHPLAYAGWALVPNIQHFWMVDPVSQNQPIPWAHVGLVALYAACLIGALLSLAVMIFQTREVG
jgi:ABC-type transport system involved in multi-copper enzyme maturation permease subunit